MTGAVEARSERETALEELLRVQVAAQPGRHLRAHAQCGHVRRVGPQMRLQLRIGPRQVVAHQGPGGVRQARVAGCGLEIAGARLIGSAGIALSVELIGEQTPAVG